MNAPLETDAIQRAADKIERALEMAELVAQTDIVQSASFNSMVLLLIDAAEELADFQRAKILRPIAHGAGRTPKS